MAIFREDQLELRRHLYNWCWEKSVNGAQLPWKTDEWLELPVHEVHASRGDHHLEFLFNERGEDLWEYRRDRTVVRPISHFRAEAALPVLPPEIVLLYESHNPSQKYLADLRLVWPRLSSEARQWLAGAMVRVQPRTVDIVEVADYDAKTDFIRSFLAAQGQLAEEREVIALTMSRSLDSKESKDGDGAPPSKATSELG